MKLVFYSVVLLLFSCHSGIPQEIIEKNSKLLTDRINAPSEYERVSVKEGSFAEYLRNLQLKPANFTVKLYNGELKNRQDVHEAIIDISVGKRDLQQCADAIMRLRAEFLWHNKQYDKISFNFTSGDRVAYTDWAKGIRPVVNGSKVTFVKKGKEDYSYDNFMKYMQTIFMYCGSFSLEKELERVDNKEEVCAGDVFIQGGFPGHAVIVLDVAKHVVNGDKVFLLAQSYMPAQEIHILKNFENDDLSPWYSIEHTDKLKTPEWDFSTNNLKRFPNQ